MSNVVVLAGGMPHAHDFTAIGDALAALYRDCGHDVDVVDHPDLAAARLSDEVDALVVAALFWRMRGRAYDAWRPQWGYATPPATRRAISEFVGGGGGLIANHTAVICFDDWPEWADIVGGSWRWGVSSHPPPGAARVAVVAGHEVVDGVDDSFEIVDEVYGDLDLGADIEVLAVAKRSPDDTDQPVAWGHRYGGGRVVYDGFGHDATSIVHPHNARILLRALDWTVRAN